jgi:hypothetical protein
MGCPDKPGNDEAREGGLKAAPDEAPRWAFRHKYKELPELDARPGNIHIMSDSLIGAGKGDFAKWLIMTIASRAPVR